MEKSIPFIGNVSRMRAREELMQSDVFGDDIKKLFPIILDGKSDSASMDMVIELLLMTGRSLPEVMMVVPEAWEKHQTMSDDKKHSTSIMLVLWSLGMALPLFRLLMEM
jgi:glutamate synthase domain-containing protein 1